MRTSGRAAPNSLAGYLLNLRHMRERIGDMELTKLSRLDIEEALVRIKAERKLSGATMRKIFTASFQTEATPPERISTNISTKTKRGLYLTPRRGLYQRFCSKKTGSRTSFPSLESRSSTIELHPRTRRYFTIVAAKGDGETCSQGANQLVDSAQAANLTDPICQDWTAGQTSEPSGKKETCLAWRVSQSHARATSMRP